MGIKISQENITPVDQNKSIESRRIAIMKALKEAKSPQEVKDLILELKEMKNS